MESLGKSETDLIQKLTQRNTPAEVTRDLLQEWLPAGLRRVGRSEQGDNADKDMDSSPTKRSSKARDSRVNGMAMRPRSSSAGDGEVGIDTVNHSSQSEMQSKANLMKIGVPQFIGEVNEFVWSVFSVHCLTIIGSVCVLDKGIDSHDVVSVINCFAICGYSLSIRLIVSLPKFT